MPEDQLPRRVEPWTCCGKSMDELVTNLYTKGVCGVHVARVMRALDRAMFVPFAEMAYMDAPQPYSHSAGRSVVSAPHVHAAVLQLMAPVLISRVTANAAVETGATLSKPVRLLDAGCGCGYIAAGLAMLAKQNNIHTAMIHGTELYDELAELAKSHCHQALDVHGVRVVKSSSAATNVTSGGGGNMHRESDAVCVCVTHGSAIPPISASSPAPLFDAIHIGWGMSSTESPGLAPFLEQLAPCGRLVASVDGQLRLYWRAPDVLGISDHGSDASERFYMQVVYAGAVPPAAMPAAPHAVAATSTEAENEDDQAMESDIGPRSVVLAAHRIDKRLRMSKRLILLHVVCPTSYERWSVAVQSPPLAPEVVAQVRTSLHVNDIVQFEGIPTKLQPSTPMPTSIASLSHNIDVKSSVTDEGVRCEQRTMQCLLPPVLVEAHNLWSTHSTLDEKCAMTASLISVNATFPDVGQTATTHWQVALQCDKKHSVRLMAYVQGLLLVAQIANANAVHVCPIEPGRNEVTLLLDVDEADCHTVLRSVCADDIASMVIKRAFAVERHRYPTFASALQCTCRRLIRTATPLTHAALRIRVQCFPRNMEKIVTRHLDSLGYTLETRAQHVTHTVSIVRSSGAYLVGVSCGCLARHWRSVVKDTVCRAFFKLREAFVIGKFSLSCEGMTAIDVGSAPGGWTAYLCSEQVRCRRVIAIDPGAMHTPLPAAAEHMQMPAQEAISKLLDSGDGATFGAFVCDANMPPVNAIDILASAAPLLQKGAHIVITMKNTFHKQAAFDEAVRVQTKRLQHEGLCTNARVVHLLANTTKELTLLGRFG